MTRSKEDFASCLELGICASCCRNSRAIFMFPTPDCDHRLCGACSCSPPPECPTCKKPYDPKCLAPDRCFKAIWDEFFKEFDAQTFKDLIEESQAKALAAKAAAKSERQVSAAKRPKTPTEGTTPKNGRKRLRLEPAKPKMLPPLGPSSSSSVSTPRTPLPESTRRSSPSTSSTPQTPSSDSFGKYKYSKRNKKGETALHELCSLGFAQRRGFSLEKLKAMMEDGANPNTMDGGGITPLHESILNGNLAIMKTLLEGGAQVNCYRCPPCTPLHTAIEKYESCGPTDLTPDSIPYQIITTLLDYGANKRLKDIFKRTPSDIAATNPTLLKLLNGYQPKRVKTVELPAPEPPMVVLHLLGSDKGGLDDMRKFETRFKVKCLPERRGFDHSVTHVIVPNDTKKANHKIRLGILNGCFIVKMEWIRQCLADETLLPAESYEIPYPLVPDSKDVYITRKARLEKLMMQPKLFVGGRFYVAPNGLDSKRRADINDLVKAGGGEVLLREPKPADYDDDERKLFHAAQDSMWEDCSVFILFSREPRGAMYHMSHMKHAPLTWFLDCIDTYSIREQ